jgi:sec-independent protein translocase protein TatA
MGVIFMSLGTPEIILIVAVLFLLFGASRLPQLARALGESRKAFREGMREAEEEEERHKQEKRLEEARSSSLALKEVDDEVLMEELHRRAEAKKRNS